MNENVSRSHEPHDRLTRLAAQMTKVLDEPENSDVRAVIMLHTDERGGIQIHGYDDDIAALAEMFVSLKAIFNANGKDIDFVGVPESPEGLS